MSCIDNFFNRYSCYDVHFMMFTLSPLELYTNWFLPFMESKVSNPISYLERTDFTGVNGTHGLFLVIDDGCGGG